MIRISVQPDLHAEWRPVLERQVNLTMGSMRDQLASLRVHFAASPGPDGESVIYQCELRSRTARGDIYRNTARNSDGGTAISDAMARTRRALEHDRQRRRLDRGRR